MDSVMGTVMGSVLRSVIGSVMGSVSACHEVSQVLKAFLFLFLSCHEKNCFFPERRNSKILIYTKEEIILNQIILGGTPTSCDGLEVGMELPGEKKLLQEGNCLDIISLFVNLLSVLHFVIYIDDIVE